MGGALETLLGDHWHSPYTEQGWIGDSIEAGPVSFARFDIVFYYHRALSLKGKKMRRLVSLLDWLVRQIVPRNRVIAPIFHKDIEQFPQYRHIHCLVKWCAIFKVAYHSDCLAGHTFSVFVDLVSHA